MTTSRQTPDQTPDQTPPRPLPEGMTEEDIVTPVVTIVHPEEPAEERVELPDELPAQGLVHRDKFDDLSDMSPIRACPSCGIRRYRHPSIPDEACFCVSCDPMGERREKVLIALDIIAGTHKEPEEEVVEV